MPPGVGEALAVLLAAAVLLFSALSAMVICAFVAPLLVAIAGWLLGRLLSAISRSFGRLPSRSASTSAGSPATLPRSTLPLSSHSPAANAASPRITVSATRKPGLNTPASME